MANREHLANLHDSGETPNEVPLRQVGGGEVRRRQRVRARLLESSVFGFPLFRHIHFQVLQKVRRDVQRDLERFSQLPIENNYEARTRAALRRTLQPLAVAWRYQRAWTLPIMFAGFIGLLIVYHVVAHRFAAHYADLLVASTISIWFVLGVVIVVMPSKFRDRLSHAFLWFSTLTGPILGSVVWAVGKKSGSAALIATGVAILGAGVVGWLTFALAFILRLAEKFILNWIGCGPECIVVRRCLNLLFVVDSQQRHWPELLWRKRISVLLEGIAQSIESCGTTSARRIGDAGSSFWIESEFRRVAAAIRDQKKWLLLPKPDTREQFWKASAAFFLSFVNCDWDGLPKLDSPRLSRKQIVTGIVRRSIGVFASVGLPGLLIWAIQRSTLALANPVRDYVLGFYLLWILVVLLSAFDPSFGTRTEIFRGLLQNLPFVGKKDH